MKRARLAPDSDLPPMDGVLPVWPGEAVPVDGRDVYVRRTPTMTGASSEPALYVHGLGGSSQNWTDLAFLLSRRLDGEAIDLPGFGYSDPGRSYAIATMAERVIRWIEYSGRGPVHLFGNSLGGAITVRVAGTRPDLVAHPDAGVAGHAVHGSPPVAAVPAAAAAADPAGRAAGGQAAGRDHPGGDWPWA